MVQEAFRAAARLGVAPSEFWALTPYQLEVISKGCAERATDDLKALAFGAWQGAALGRMPKLPPLAKFLNIDGSADAPPAPSPDEVSQKARAIFTAMMKRRGK